MKITAIFEKVKGRLYAAKFGDEQEDEFEKALSNWQNRIYLREFFSQYRVDLSRFDPSIKVKNAIHLASNDASAMHDRLMRLASRDNLDEIFEPLDNRDDPERLCEFQKVKTRGLQRKSMIRLYAIRMSDWYVMSGSALKLTDKMDRPHLRAELHKLDLVRQYLQNNRITGLLE